MWVYGRYRKILRMYRPSKILRMYQPAGAVPQETIDSSTLGRKGSFISFFNLNVCKGMCVCVCVCVCMCICVCVCVWIDSGIFLSLIFSDFFSVLLFLQGKQRVLAIQLISLWTFLLQQGYSILSCCLLLFHWDPRPYSRVEILEGFKSSYTGDFIGWRGKMLPTDQ